LKLWRAKKIVSKIIPKELFGVVFKGICYPLIDDNGEIFGAVGIGKSLEKQAAIEEATENIFKSNLL